MKLKNLLLLFAILALLVGATGCIFSPEEGEETPEPVDTLPPATNTDILMSNFEKIYEGMLYDEYEKMLHPSYKTILLQETIDDWENSGTPLDQDYFDRTVELEIHHKIFDNLTGVDEDGDSVDPIESINVLVLDKQGTWTVVEDSDENFGGLGAYYNQYEVFIHFEQSDKRFEVHQNVDFFVVQVNGIWKMVGQKGYPGVP